MTFLGEKLRRVKSPNRRQPGSAERLGARQSANSNRQFLQNAYLLAPTHAPVVA